MILALKDNEKITVGVSSADFLVNMSTRDLALKENLPFWKVKGVKDCYVCLEDLTYDVGLFQYNDSLFVDVTDIDSIIKNFVPQMKEILRKHERLIGEKWGNSMLIIKDNKMYKIDTYFCAQEVRDFTAFGAESYLIGVIEETQGMDSTQRILHALRTVNRLRNRNYFPLMVFDTKNMKRKVYYN